MAAGSEPWQVLSKQSDRTKDLTGQQPSAWELEKQA